MEAISVNFSLSVVAWNLFFMQYYNACSLHAWGAIGAVFAQAMDHSNDPSNNHRFTNIDEV